MLNCPYCGHSLQDALNDGVALCTHCGRIFQSTRINRLLAAAWLLKKHQGGWDRFVFETKLSEEEAKLVWSYILDEGYSIEQFQKAVTSLVP